MGLIFDGVDLEIAYGVVVSGAGTWAKPKRDRELVHVPGRNGDLIYDNGCWLNVEIPYSLYFREGWRYKYEEFCEWLCSHNGYFRLEDTDRHPGVYRMAEFSGPLDPKKWLLSDDGIVTITFNCKPQQWLIEGETPVEISGTLYVNGYFDSNGDWKDGGENGIATVLLVSETIDGNYTLRVENNSDDAKTVLIGTGKYDTEESTPSASVNSETINAGESYSVSIPVGGTFFRDSIYCEDGLDGLTLSLSSNMGEYVIDCDKLFTSVYNPTSYNASPLIDFYSSGSTLYINGFEVDADRVHEEGSPIPLDIPVYVDCELEDCYYILDGVVHNHNGSVSISNSDAKEMRDFPYLKPGANDLYFGPASKLFSITTWRTGLSGINVIPRWHKI